MEVAVVVLGASVLVAITGLTISVMFLTRKVAQRDNDFVQRIVDSTMENMVAAYWRGSNDRNSKVPVEGVGPISPAVPFGVEPGPPDPEDEDIEEVGIN